MQLLGTMMILAQESTTAVPKRSWQSWDLSDSTRLIAYIGMLIVALVIGGVLLKYLRRQMVAKESKLAGTGSLMDELRRLRKEGVLTESEYEASRRAATAGMRASMSAGAEAPTAKQVSSASGPHASGKPPRPPPPRAPKPPVKPLTSGGPVDGLQAKPGFDLTGAPLPPRNQNYEKKPDEKYDPG